LCEEKGVSKEEVFNLSRLFTDSGVIFHSYEAQDPILATTVILKPKNLSEIISALFGDKALFSGSHSLEAYNKLVKEYDELTDKKAVIDQMALKSSNRWIVACGAYMVLQASILARLTWWEFSWDIMEPITYFITVSTGIVGWTYFAMTKNEYTYQNLRDQLANRKKIKLYKRKGFDLRRYHYLETILGSRGKED